LETTEQENKKMTKFQFPRILASTALCLAAGTCVSCSSRPVIEPSGNMATEWQNYYPEDATLVQGCVSKMTAADSADMEEGWGYYVYFVADHKIAYIEESFSTSMVAVCIRYLFDASGAFVAAACRISTQSVFSDDWTHSQMFLVRGQHLKVERCGISEAIDERARHIMKRCLADWKQQSKKIRK
jgi:hypothetical protein